MPAKRVFKDQESASVNSAKGTVRKALPEQPKGTGYKVTGTPKSALAETTYCKPKPKGKVKRALGK